MKSVLIFFLSAFIFFDSWVHSNIGNNLTIQFPEKPKIENIFKDDTSFSASNSNCEFSVDVSNYPAPVFPNNEKEAVNILERSVALSKEKGVFISSKSFMLGKIKGIEIKEYFTPSKSVKLIQVNRKFFINYELYTLRCLYKKNKSENNCEKDCRHFFSSLKFKQ